MKKEKSKWYWKKLYLTITASIRNLVPNVSSEHSLTDSVEMIKKKELETSQVAKYHN